MKPWERTYKPSDDAIPASSTVKPWERQYAPAATNGAVVKSFDPATYGDDWKAAKTAIESLPEDQRDPALKSYADHYVALERKDGGVLQEINDYVRMFARNVPIVGELADEMNAATSGDYKYGMAYEKALRRAIDKKRRAGINTPLGRVDVGDAAKTAGFVGGAIVSPMAKAAQAAGALGHAGTAALNGAIYGAAEGFGVKDGTLGERAGEAVKVGLGSAALGAGVSRVGSVISKAANLPHFRSAKSARSADSQKAQAQRLYKKADEGGSAILSGTTPNAAGRTLAEEIQHRVITDLTNDGFHKKIQKKITPLVDELQRLTGEGHITFKGLETTRKMVGNVARTGGDDERRMAMNIITHIDDVLDDAIKSASKGGGQVLQGDLKKQVAVMKRARSAWHKMKKTSIIEDALSRGETRASVSGIGGNIDNTTRQKLQRIIDTPSLSRSFTKNELEAIRQAARGRPGTNALRILGSLAPTNASLMMGVAAGAGAYGGAHGLALVGSSWAAKALANRATRKAGQVILAGVSNNNLRPYYGRWQRAVRMFEQKKIGEPLMKTITLATASALAKETGSEMDPLYKMMLESALKEQSGRDHFKEAFGSKESK